MSPPGTSCIHSNLTDDFRAPILFYKPKMALIGPEALITVPKAAQPVEKHVPDWEVELTVVIGKPCKDVSESEALDYVLGYMTGNDVRLEFVCFHAILFLLSPLDFIPLPSNGSLAMGIFERLW